MGIRAQRHRWFGSGGFARPHHPWVCLMNSKNRRKEIIEFYEKHCVQVEHDECTIWPFSRAGRGYAVWSKNNKPEYVHVLMAEKQFGPRPSKLHQVAHSCGNGTSGCVNPNHVRWATIQENANDKIIHGTSGKGSRNSMAKITEKDVEMIRRLRAMGMKQKVISKIYNLSEQSISFIVLGINWSHTFNKTPA